MTRRITMLTVFVGVLGVLGGAALAERSNDFPPPPVIAERCIQQLNRIAERTVRRMHVRTRNCLRVIGRLLEAGEEQRAEEVAQRCIETVNHMAEHGAMGVRRTAEHCVEVLTRLEAPMELIMAVREAGDRALNVIAQHRETEIERIEQALNGPPTDSDVGDSSGT